MSEKAGRSPKPPSSVDKKKQEHPEPVEDYAHPSTHQMKIIGRRRVDAEAKLNERQRDARDKSTE